MSQPKTEKKRGVLYLIKGVVELPPIKLRRDSTILGRDKGDIVIKDPEVSSSHCQIQPVSGDYYIFDMNSTNGTFVNGKKIVKHQLEDNDKIAIGQNVFRFELKATKDLHDIPSIKDNQQVTKLNDSFDDLSLRATLIDTLIENQASVKTYTLQLEISYNDNKSETVELDLDSTFIGRASNFGRFDQDPEISRRHLLVKLNDQGEIFVEDQGSTNGSFINEKKIKGMHKVSSTDLVRVGSTILRMTALSKSE